MRIARQPSLVLSVQLACLSLTTMATTEHAADEAGGEVIYSYDGDEQPAVVTQAPPLPASATSNDDPGVTAPQAFETFAGKVYAPTSFVGAFSSSKGETALERLGRLQQEIQQIEQDLSLTTASASGGSAADAASGGKNDKELDDVQSNLLLSVQEMKLRLARVAVIPPQETLTTNIQTAATALQSPSKGGGGGDASFSLDPKAMGESTMTALVSRLQRLERLTGANTVSSGNDSVSFLERLTSLEETLSKVDEKELETRAKKAKVIRQDLEAAAKARNKLMANTSSTGTTSTAASDAKIISGLHDQLVQLHGLTPHLPLLAQRLQALARQHQEAALQASQLQATQEMAEQLVQQVGQLEQAVETTETAMQQAAQQMAQNMQALDARFPK